MTTQVANRSLNQRYSTDDEVGRDSSFASKVWGPFVRRLIAKEKAKDQDYIRRALAAWFRHGGLARPSRSSDVYRFANKEYVHLRDHNGTLAVYRISNTGRLKRLKQWPMPSSGGVAYIARSLAMLEHRFDHKKQAEILKDTACPSQSDGSFALKEMPTPVAAPAKDEDAELQALLDDLDA